MIKIKWNCALLIFCTIGLMACRQHRKAKGISFVKSSPSQIEKGKESITLGDQSTNLSLSNIVSGSPAEDVILEHHGFVVSYNRNNGTPSWVAWELTSNETSGPVSRDDYDYMPDPLLESQYQIEKKEYANSGYDRGHMCPAGDMEWSADAMNDCHYMTNICPQSPKLNQIHWERLESSCRRWANKLGYIYIVCGPIYKSNNVKTIDSIHTIKVPDSFFKVIVNLNKGEERGIGFIYDNSDIRQTMESTSLSIKQVEELTGYDFFYELPDNIEDKIESSSNLSKW